MSGRVSRSQPRHCICTSASRDLSAIAECLVAVALTRYVTYAWKVEADARNKRQRECFLQLVAACQLGLIGRCTPIGAAYAFSH